MAGLGAAAAGAPPRRGRGAAAGPSDAVLVAACRRGDQEAWRALVERYAGLIYSIPLRRGLGPELAEEVFQSVCLTLVERIHLIADPSCLPKWLMVTASRRASAVGGRGWREVAADDAAEAAADAAERPDRRFESESRRQAVRRALGALGERDRELLADLFERELPYAEVARRHRLKVGSLGALRARALGRLRRELEKGERG